MRIDRGRVRLIVRNIVMAEHISGAIIGLNGTAVGGEVIILQKYRLFSAERQWRAPGCGRAVHGDGVAEIGRPIVNKLVVEDQTFRLAVDGPVVANQFYSGAGKLGKAAAEDEKVSAVSAQYDPLILDVIG